MITEVAESADPAALEAAAGRLARAATGLGTAGDRLSDPAVPGWSGDGARHYLDIAGARRVALRAASDAFGAASDGLRRYAEAVRSVQTGSKRAATTRDDAGRATAAWRSGNGHGSDPGADDRLAADRALAAVRVELNSAAARAVAVLRQAASMAPAVVPPPRTPVEPAVQAISWGDALDKVAGAGKAAARGVEDGASAVGHGAESAGKVLARGDEVLLEGGEGDLLSALGFVDDLGAAMDGTAHQVLSSMGESAEQVWSGLERVAGARPGAALSLESFEQWEGWLGQLGLAVSVPMAQGALRAAGQVSRGALAVGRALTTDAGRYREIAAQNEHPPIKDGPTYDQIHRTAKSDLHILVGSARGGGGHRPRTGWATETEFPEDWDDTRILKAIDQASQNPTSPMQRSVAVRGGAIRYSYVCEAEGLKIVVALDKESRIVSAYPLKDQKGIFQNPPKPKKPSGVTQWGPRWIRPDRDPHGTGYFVWHQADGRELYTDSDGSIVSR
jgi:uncharacterized protein YukE